jgi:hypothetical protein
MQAILSSARQGMTDHVRAVKSGLPPTTGVHFLTFANTDYMAPTRIVNEARPFGFATITAMNEHSIPDVIERHRDFIRDNPQGYGVWIWKPSVILRRLQELPEGDVLVYADAGMHLNVHGQERYWEYMHALATRDMVVFALPPTYKAQHYVKRDAIDSYYPEFATRTILDPYHYAGLLILKNTPATRHVMTEWLSLCEVHHFIDRSESQAKDHPSFLGNDCDNGLLNLCLAKHPSLLYAVPPGETNVYDRWGYQDHSATPTDWEKLRRYPFQIRRLRPRYQPDVS